jgi:hypothetical protein
VRVTKPASRLSCTDRAAPPTNSREVSAGAFVQCEQFSTSRHNSHRFFRFLSPRGVLMLVFWSKRWNERCRHSFQTSILHADESRPRLQTANSKGCKEDGYDSNELQQTPTPRQHWTGLA